MRFGCNRIKSQDKDGEYQHIRSTESHTLFEYPPDFCKYPFVKHPYMKLAEALMERAELRKRISTLSTRLEDNAQVYEGEEPHEDPKRMLEELDIIIPKYAELVARINIVNATTVASDGHSLAELIAARDALITKADVLNKLIESATESQYGYRNDMPKLVPSVDVRSLRRESDAVSKEAREKDMLIQATNWTTEI